MRIFLYILHSIALIVGIVLMVGVPMPIGIKDILIYALSSYTMAVLAVLVMRPFLIGALPGQIGAFIVYCFVSFLFFSRSYIMMDHIHLSWFLISASSLTALSSLVITFKSPSFHFKYNKTDLSGFNRIFISGLSFYVLLLAVLLITILIIERNDNKSMLARASAVLLAIVPLMNKRMVYKISEKLKGIKNFTDGGIGLEQFGKLGKIKNFVFFKDKILSTAVYQMAESEFRSSVKVATVIQIARMLANDWNPRYSRLFVMDEFEKVDLVYRMVGKNENGITVIDDDACMYHLGNSTYVKDKIKWDDRTNLFLLKNDIPIAKFRINEKILNDKIELLNQLDYYGKTLLIYSGHSQDLGDDYTIIFDKIYDDVDQHKQLDLLKELEKEGPSAIFTTKSPNEIVNSIIFIVSSNVEIQKDPSIIAISPEKLFEVPQIFDLAKRVNSLFRSALLYSFAIQLLFGILALLLYKYLIILFALNFGFTLLSGLIEGYIATKISYLPSQKVFVEQQNQAV